MEISTIWVFRHAVSILMRKRYITGHPTPSACPWYPSSEAARQEATLSLIPKSAGPRPSTSGHPDVREAHVLAGEWDKNCLPGQLQGRVTRAVTQGPTPGLMLCCRHREIFFFFFFSCFGCTRSTWTFLGQGWHLSHSSDNYQILNSRSHQETPGNS